MASRRERWSEEQMQHFIKLYKRRECLWDENLPSFKDLEARDIAIAALNKKMKAKGYKDVDSKWRIKTLRSKYRQELTKIENEQRLGNVYKPTVRWFKPLDAFLRPFFVNRDRKVNKENGSDTDESVADKSDEDSDSAQVVLTDESDDAEDSEPEPPKPKKIKIKGSSDNLTANKSPGMPSTVLTSLDLFRHNVAAHLKDLPMQQALSMHAKLQTILSEELFRCYVEMGSQK